MEPPPGTSCRPPPHHRREGGSRGRPRRPKGKARTRAGPRTSEGQAPGGTRVGRRRAAPRRREGANRTTKPQRPPHGVCIWGRIPLRLPCRLRAIDQLKAIDGTGNGVPQTGPRCPGPRDCAGRGSGVAAAGHISPRLLSRGPRLVPRAEHVRAGPGGPDRRCASGAGSPAPVEGAAALPRPPGTSAFRGEAPFGTRLLGAFRRGRPGPLPST